MQIQPFDKRHLEAVVQLSLRAWKPVFDSIQNQMNADVYREFYPDGWSASQQKAVEEACAAKDMRVWTAMEAAVTMGFVAVRLHRESKMGEIYMIAVEPDFQGRGVATALTDFALVWMKGEGMTVAMGATGGDDKHAW